MMKKALVLALIPSVVLATVPASHAKLAQAAATKAVKAEKAAVKGRLAQLLNAGQSTVANTYGFVEAKAKAYPKTAKLLALVAAHEAGRRGDVTKLLTKVPYIGAKAARFVRARQHNLDNGIARVQALFAKKAPARSTVPTTQPDANGSASQG